MLPERQESQRGKSKNHMIPKRDYNKVEILNFLGMLYAELAVKPKVISLKDWIQKCPELKSRMNETRIALKSSGILIGQGKRGWQAYQWNKKIGPPSLPLVDILITEIRKERSLQNCRYSKRRIEKRNATKA